MASLGGDADRLGQAPGDGGADEIGGQRHAVIADRRDQLLLVDPGLDDQQMTELRVAVLLDHEDDVVEVDGSPGRIVRVGMWKTVFFIYHVVNGKVVGGSKLVVANSKLKDLKIEKPLPNPDLSKYDTE